MACVISAVYRLSGNQAGCGGLEKREYARVIRRFRWSIHAGNVSWKDVATPTSFYFRRFMYADCDEVSYIACPMRYMEFAILPPNMELRSILPLSLVKK